MTEEEYTAKTAKDAIKGLEFLRRSNGKYKLIANTHDDGTISITLNEVAFPHDKAKVLSPLFALNLGDIYAQCAPSEIIERLNNDITDKYNLMQRVRENSHETMPEIALPEITLVQRDMPF